MNNLLRAMNGSHGWMIAVAYAFSTAAHGAVGQLRPTVEDPLTPYIVHPTEVADIVAGVTDDPNTIMAALLHDVVEDTQVSILTIERFFGVMVASYVIELTDYYTKERFPELNRDERKSLEAKRLGTISNTAKTIKLADGISNTPSIAINRPKFMPTYGKEKRNTITYLVGGDERLLIRLDADLAALGY